MEKKAVDLNREEEKTRRGSTRGTGGQGGNTGCRAAAPLQGSIGGTKGQGGGRGGVNGQGGGCAGNQAMNLSIGAIVARGRGT